MDGNNNNKKLVRTLEQYCTSDDISLVGLRDRLNQITKPTALVGSHFLHELCLNKNVTLDTVQLVLDNNPYAAYCASNDYHDFVYTDVDRYKEEKKEAGDRSSSSDSAIRSRRLSFPIHLAALNIQCPDAVIELLAKNYPLALRHLSNIDAEVCDDYDTRQIRPNKIPDY